MAALRVENFLRKSWDERLMTAQYLVRQSPAKNALRPGAGSNEGF
jgi:hypothetical protein